MRARVVISAIAVTATVAVPLVARATSVGTPTLQLANTAMPGLAAATDLGAVPAATKLAVTVALAHPDLSGERAVLASMYDKSSPTYHHFLTPTQYADRFGASADTLSRVSSWLTRDGMTVGYTAPTRTLVTVIGTAAQAQRTFGVTLHNFRIADQTFRANLQAATVPQGVVAVRGLETASAYKLPAHTAASAPAQNTCVTGQGCIGGLTPSDLWSVYNQPSNNQGLGVKVGIIGEGDTTTTIKALRNFETKYALPTVNVRSVFVADDRSDDSGRGEWELDSEAIQGMAPQIAELDYYFAQDLSSTDAALSEWANEDPTTAPSIANMSIGGCEAINVALGGTVATEAILTQLAAEGRTLFVSSGDTGGSCAVFNPLVNLNGVENTGVPNTQWPASSDAVVSVGGTVLYTDGQTPAHRVLEYTWTHGGGGTSFFVPRPAWQASVPVIQGRCVADLSLNPVTGDTPCRGVPDVSALSADILTNYYATVDETGADSFGAGTSLSSPLWAGMWARVQAASATPLGFAAPLLYGVGTDTTKAAGAFFDITTGTNGQYDAIPANPADPSGWDYTNGFGPPHLDGLMTDIAGSTAPVATANPAPQADQVVVVSGSSGGGGGTCGANGVVDDPQGDDAFGIGVNTDDTDLTQVVAAYDAKNAAVTWTAHVVNLTATPEAKAFEFNFAYGGSTLDLLTTRDVQNAVSVELDKLDPTTGSLNPVATTGLSARWDDANNQVTVTMPLSVYNAAVQPATPLASGATLTGLDYLADRQLTQTSQLPGLLFAADEAATSCGYVIPVSTSPTAHGRPSPKPSKSPKH